MFAPVDHASSQARSASQHVSVMEPMERAFAIIIHSCAFGGREFVFLSYPDVVLVLACLRRLGLLQSFTLSTHDAPRTSAQTNSAARDLVPTEKTVRRSTNALSTQRCSESLAGSSPPAMRLARRHSHADAPEHPAARGQRSHAMDVFVPCGRRTRWPLGPFCSWRSEGAPRRGHRASRLARLGLRARANLASRSCVSWVSWIF